jgi:hypothetical protein
MTCFRLSEIPDAGGGPTCPCLATIFWNNVNWPEMLRFFRRRQNQDGTFDNLVRQLEAEMRQVQDGQTDGDTTISQETVRSLVSLSRINPNSTSPIADLGSQLRQLLQLAMRRTNASSDTRFVSLVQQLPGDVPAAEQALAAARASHGDSSIEVVLATAGLASAYLMTNNLDGAARELQATLNALRNLSGFGPNSAWYAVIEGMLSAVRMRQGCAAICV